MANEILVKSDDIIPVTFTSLSSSSSNTTTGAVQSLKTDLGATRAQQMVVRLQVQFAAAPTTGTALEVYAGFSSQSTATSGNVAALTGADAAWTGISNNCNEAKRLLQFVGQLTVCALSSTSVGVNAQICDVGSFIPIDRYVQLVVVNMTNQALAGTATWHACNIYPVVDEVND